MKDKDRERESAEPLSPLPPWRGGHALTRRWAEATGMDKLNAILSLPDVPGYIESLRPDELFYLVKDIGAGDSLDLLRYVTPEQWQGFADLDCWRGDQFEETALEEWIATTVAAGLEVTASFVDALDPELLALYLLKVAQIHEKDLDVDFVTDANTLLTTPDGEHYLEIPVDHPSIPHVQRLLRTLYARDIRSARAIVRAARWELSAAAEEDCLRWRTGRLEEMGFPSREDAELLYERVAVGRVKSEIRAGLDDAASVTGVSSDEPLSQGLALPPLEESPFLSAALARVEQPEARDRIAQSFVYVTHGVLIADRAELGSVEANLAASRASFASVNLGLELLADGDPAVGARILERTWLREIFKVGHTVTDELRARAKRLLHRTETPSGSVLLDPPFDEIVAGANRAHPELYSGTTDEGHPRYEPIRTVEQLRTLQAVLAQGEAVVSFFEEFVGFSPAAFDATELEGVSEDQRQFVRFSTLLLTAVANFAIGKGWSLDPLSAAGVDLFAAAVIAGTGDYRTLDTRLREQLDRQLTPAEGTAAPERDRMAALRQYVSRCLDSLEEALAPLPGDQPVDPRYLGSLLLVRE